MAHVDIARMPAYHGGFQSFGMHQFAYAPYPAFPQSFSPAETVFFLDWDDTLFPTSVFRERGLLHEKSLPEELAPVLKGHAKKVEELLAALQELGQVIIVTGSGGDWVAHTAKRFLGITTLPPSVSARTQYGHLGEDPLVWKEAAFRDALASLGTPTGWKNVISIGDAEVERQALCRVCAYQPTVIPKAMKLMDNPSLDTLTKQLTFLYDRLEPFMKHPGPLNTTLSPMDIAHVTPFHTRKGSPGSRSRGPRRRQRGRRSAGSMLP
uniref:Uncharacterized protein n=1 Tax=Oxyrrhis marina TaxID=2969 RepID=A0A7S4GQE3_OXYMA|mmetsp:Transcript_18350/g.44194  ORF Transcript_18350/g.44194 Transcript_18350/m.44194 type:complete len:266 (+) Transcript_18350:92-889(+)